MSNEKDNAIFPEILPDEKGKLLGHNWLKVPKKKRIGDESLATPNSTKTAGYDRFIFEEYIDKDGLVKEGFIFQALSRTLDALPSPKLKEKEKYHGMMHDWGKIRGNRQYFEKQMEREQTEEDQPQQVQQQEVSLPQGQPQAGPMPQAQPPQQPQAQPPQRPQGQVSGIQQPQETAPKDQGAQGGIDSSNEVVQKILASLENVINTLRSTPEGQRAQGGIDLSDEAVQRILPVLENVINTLRSTPKGQRAQGGIDLSNADVQELLSSIRNVINTPGSTSGKSLRSDTPASMITYNDLLRKPRINISQIPDIPLLDQFIKDPAATAETQQIFKQVYSTLGYTPPILANTLRRMYDLYEAADNVKTPYEAERVRRQINRMSAIIEGQRKWYDYGMELLNKHPEVLREVAGNELRDAADNTDRQILMAAGIAASQFLRARRAYEKNNVPFNEEKQKSRLREAVRNAFYNYAGGSDPALIAKVEEVAQRLIQAETNPQAQQQA